MVYFLTFIFTSAFRKAVDHIITNKRFVIALQHIINMFVFFYLYAVLLSQTILYSFCPLWTASTKSVDNMVPFSTAMTLKEGNIH